MKKRAVIELDHIKKPLLQMVDDAMRINPDEIEIVGNAKSNALFADEIEQARERLCGTGHVLLTGDICRSTDGVNVVVLE
jgi:hypothetical protein